MRFGHAIDEYLEDMRSHGRINSDSSERAYFDVLVLHAEDANLRDPRQTTRDDVKVTLRRWSHSNTQHNRRSILVSFYDWLMEEGHRRDNPARQTRKPRKRQAQVYRMTLKEVIGFLTVAAGDRERRIAYLGVCAGLRMQELRGLQGRHFGREGWVWVSDDIGKGRRSRWVPVIPDLEPIVKNIRRHVEPAHYVLPCRRHNVQGDRSFWRERPTQPSSAQSVYRLVKGIGERAGIDEPIHPHLMRHAFADHITRYAGVRVAQSLLGHADLGTTETYLGNSTLDELAQAVAGFSFMNGEGGHTQNDPQSHLYRHGDSNPGSCEA